MAKPKRYIRKHNAQQNRPDGLLGVVIADGRNGSSYSFAIK